MPSSSADSDLKSTSLAGPQGANERTPLLESNEPRRGSTESLGPALEGQYGVEAPNRHDAQEVVVGKRKEQESSKSITGIAGVISVLLLGALNPQPLK